MSDRIKKTKSTVSKKKRANQRIFSLQLPNGGCQLNNHIVCH